MKNDDPWHFSHLGENYFRRIANNFRATDIANASIKDLYIGRTGIPYIGKNNGRLVNPNWCVRLMDGKEFKFGTPTINSLLPGLWDLHRCIHFEWSEIVNFYRKDF